MFLLFQCLSLHLKGVLIFNIIHKPNADLYDLAYTCTCSTVKYVRCTYQPINENDAMAFFTPTTAFCKTKQNLIIKNLLQIREFIIRIILMDGQILHIRDFAIFVFEQT